MKNKKTLSIVFGLLILLALVLWVLFSNRQATPMDSVQTSQRAAVEEKNDAMQGEKISGSFLDLMKMGKNMTCTYSNTVEADGSKFEGTSYVSGNKMRTNLTLLDKDGAKTETTMVGDGEWMYVWTSLQEQGFKMSMQTLNDTVGSTAPNNSPAQKNLADFNKSVDYDCKPLLIVDPTLFAVPTDREFLDLNSMIQNVVDNMNTGETGSNCAVCNMITDDAQKQQCLQSMGC